MNLQEFKDTVSKAVNGMTAQEAIQKNLCVSCKQTPTFYTEAGRKEYKISGLCEDCFDEISRELEE